MTPFSISSDLAYLIDKQQQHLLRHGLKGLEKESLRISTQGKIASTPHPHSLGAALTHPLITTDYSESLLEFITQPFTNIKDTLNSLENIHQFVYQHLDNEILLGTSMPCGIDGDNSIPIAYYGTSNIGKMKYIYRQGLAHRYGRTMQSIAGIHFNYSVPKPLWTVLKHHDHNPSESLAEFISRRYFGLIRNFQRQGWLILYLFGASPAVCKRFFKSRPQLITQFEEFDSQTLFHPFSTSLRMSDIGYKSSHQANLNIDYNSLEGYVNTLVTVMKTPYSAYEAIGIKVKGTYQQLSPHILQIENEFYSTVRPKQITFSGEKPTTALKKRGVEYIEIRSLDLDLFNPIGIDENKARFMEAFLLSCLLEKSPLRNTQEQAIDDKNQRLVAYTGRQANLKLNRQGKEITLKNWAHQILQTMTSICKILDADDSNKPYTTALTQQQRLIDNPELTPSAKILQQMRQHQQAFGCLSVDISKQHATYFKSKPALEKSMRQYFDNLVKESHQQQQQREQTDEIDFDIFLANYLE